MNWHQPHSKQQLAREKALYLYGNALERGDFATVESVLREAEADPVLERMLAAWDEALLQQIETDRTLEGKQLTNSEAQATVYSQSDAAAVAIVRQQFHHHVEEHHLDRYIPPDETKDLPTEQPAGMAGERRVECGGQCPFREAPAVPTRLYPRRTRRFLSWTATVAAVLAIAIISGALFVSHRTATGTHPASITNTPQPIATLPSGVYINTYHGAPGSQSGAVYALNPSDGTTRWSANEPAGVHIVARPVLYQGVLYTLWEDLNNDTSGIMTAFDAKSGKHLWTVDLHSVVDNVTLTLADGDLYLGLRTGQVVALDASTGMMRWHTQTSGDAQVELIADGVVYVTSAGAGLAYTLSALNASDGSVRWHYQGHAAFGKVEVADGQVYFLAVGSTDIPQPSGTQAATSSACCQPQSAAAPDVNNSGNGNAVLSILDPVTGNVRWLYAATGNTLNDFEASGSLFYLFLNTPGKPAAPANLLEAYDASTHQVVWRFSVASGPAAAIDSTAWMNGALYLTTNDTLYALNASTGKHLWQVPMQNGALCDPTTCPPDQGDALYVESSSHLYALHRADGALVWSVDAPAYSSVAAVAGQMVCLDLVTTINPTDGKAHGGFLVLSASDGKLLWRHDENAESTSPVVG